MKFGTGKIGSSSKKKYFKLEKGESVYRIIPPFGPMADTDTWAVYYRVHFGYKGLPNPKTGKAYMRAFVSPEVKNFKNNMIEVIDPANERIRQLKEALAAAKERNDGDASKQIVALLKTYNLDSKYHVNAINLQGEIGLLKIPYKAFKSLEAEIVALRQSGTDPLSVENGRYFSFKRSGEGFETQYAVSVYKTKLEVAGHGIVEKEAVHVLTPDLISKLGTVNPTTGDVTFDRDGHNLLSLYARPTVEQVARMVKEGPSAVEEILGQGAQEEEEDSDDVDSALASTAAAAAKTAATTPVAAAPAAPTAAPIAAAPAPTPAPTTQTVAGLKIGGGTSASAPAATPAAASNQSVEDFLKSMGLG